MAHPVPKDLTGEERVLTLPYLDLYLNKRGIVYNGLASLIAIIIFKLSNDNLILFVILFIILNAIVYPLAHMKTAANNFEGGNVRLDIYLFRKFKYKKNKKIYIRRRRKYLW